MKAKVLNLHTNRVLFYVLIAISIISTVVYIYGISRAVHNVAERQSLKKQLSTLTVQVSDLEFQYLSLKNNVDMNLALSLGFEQTDEAHFVSRVGSASYAGKEVARR
jgi:uncharacterized membrane protein